MKSSKETVQAYFNAYNQKDGWEQLVSDNIVFNGASDMPVVKGIEGFIKQNQQFLMAMQRCRLDSTIADDDKVAVTATYDLALPGGDTHTLKTIEIYTVSNGKISNIYIAFDTAKFYEFMSKMPQN